MEKKTNEQRADAIAELSIKYPDLTLGELESIEHHKFPTEPRHGFVDSTEKMTVRFYVRNKSGMLQDDHLLELGSYNEYYLPAIRSDAEAWLVITDKDGTQTKLHLKR